VACGIVPPGCGGGGEEVATTPAQTREAAEPVTIDLRETNESGQSGMATLTDQGESSSGISLGTRVVLEISPPVRFPGDVQPAAIHSAPCEELRKRRGSDELSVTEVQPLIEVRDGRSETTAAKSLQELGSGGFAVAVHEPNPPFRTVVCGDIAQP
jgi:hypothetical protein